VQIRQEKYARSDEPDNEHQLPDGHDLQLAEGYGQERRFGQHLSGVEARPS
jgi:hypothetical protein